MAKGLKPKSNTTHIKVRWRICHWNWWMNGEITKETFTYYRSPYLCNKDRQWGPMHALHGRHICHYLLLLLLLLYEWIIAYAHIFGRVYVLCFPCAFSNSYFHKTKLYTSMPTLLSSVCTSHLLRFYMCIIDRVNNYSNTPIKAMNQTSSPFFFL